MQPFHSRRTGDPSCLYIVGSIVLSILAHQCPISNGSAILIDVLIMPWLSVSTTQHSLGYSEPVQSLCSLSGSPCVIQHSLGYSEPIQSLCSLSGSPCVIQHSLGYSEPIQSLCCVSYSTVCLGLHVSYSTVWVIANQSAD